MTSSRHPLRKKLVDFFRSMRKEHDFSEKKSKLLKIDNVLESIFAEVETEKDPGNVKAGSSGFLFFLFISRLNTKQ